MSMASTSFDLDGGILGFNEDKDYAKYVREEHILPHLEAGVSVVLDFTALQFSTQSFVHALIGQALKQYGEPVLDRIEFQNCSEQLRSLIELVIDYSLGGFEVPAPQQPAAVRKRSATGDASGSTRYDRRHKRIGGKKK